MAKNGKLMKLMDSEYARSYIKQTEKVLTKDEALVIREKAEENYRRLLLENANIPKEIAMHTDKSIFPAIAVYKAVRENHSEMAMEIMEKGAAWVSAKKGEALSKMMKIPGFKSVFMKVFSLGVKTSFGTKAGFTYRFISDTTRRLEFDMLKCPYANFCKKYGCEELTHIFCKNDEYAYGGIPGIKFIRTETLGTGGERCDFKFKRQ